MYIHTYILTGSYPGSNFPARSLRRSFSSSSVIRSSSSLTSSYTLRQDSGSSALARCWSRVSLRGFLYRFVCVCVCVLCHYLCEIIYLYTQRQDSGSSALARCWSRVSLRGFMYRFVCAHVCLATVCV